MVDMYRTLDSIPVLAKAGGILVMTDEIRGTEAEKNPESLMALKDRGDLFLG